MARNPYGGDKQIFILTGNPGSGKSSFLLALMEIIRDRNLLAAGFIAPSVLNEDAPRSYILMDISSGETMPLASRVYSEGWQEAGSFYFNPEALNLGNRILTDPRICENDLVVVDEIGPLELGGGIWADAVTFLRDKCACSMIWVVRKRLLGKVVRKWHLGDPVIVDVETQSIDLAVKEICSGFRANID